MGRDERRSRKESRPVRRESRPLKEQSTREEEARPSTRSTRQDRRSSPPSDRQTARRPGLCDKCVEALARRHDTYLGDDYNDPDISDGRDTLTAEPTTSTHSKKPRWVWKPSELDASARSCSFCQYMKDILRKEPMFTAKKSRSTDRIVLEPQFVGLNLHEGKPRGRCYRLKLQVYAAHRDSWYRPGAYVLLLPLSSTSTARQKQVEESDDSSDDSSDEGSSSESLSAELFHGRHLGERVDFALLNEWRRKCHADHGPGCRIDGQLNNTKRDFSKFFEPDDSRRETIKPGYHVVPEISYPVQATVPSKEGDDEHLNLRVIDVQSRQLVKAPKGCAYVTLSYVTGPGDRFSMSAEDEENVTKKDGIMKLGRNIPQTFSDAMAVTHHLGLRHIWIDALCIKNTDHADKQAHPHSMHKIFRQSVLTIVSGTDSADSGLAGVRPRTQTQILYQTSLSGQPMKLLSSKMPFAMALEEASWERRAWTLQERLFAKTLLIFTKDQVFYQCGKATWFEDTVLEPAIPPTKSITVVERASSNRTPTKAYRPRIHEAMIPFTRRNFWSLIEHFIMSRNLTYDKDVLNAVAGILQSVERTYGQAIWGVPAGLFGSGLSWELNCSSMRRRDGFPSWSWAGWKFNSPGYMRFCAATAPEGMEPEWHYYRETKSSQGQQHILTKIVRDRHQPRDIGEMKRHLSSQPQARKPGGMGRLQDLLSSKKTKSSDNREEQLQQTFDVPPLQHFSNIPIPLSHVIRFWTSISFLNIAKDHDGKHSSSGPVQYSVTHRSAKEPLTKITLTPEWRAAHGNTGLFIVVSQGFHPPSKHFHPSEEGQDRESSRLLNVMLVERLKGARLFQRVNMCRSCITVGARRDTEPDFELINLV